jgi:hypothetical protein
MFPTRRIDHAGIKGPRIDVQRYGALLRFPRIHHPVHRLPRIDRARIAAVNSTVLDASN